MQSLAYVAGSNQVANPSLMTVQTVRSPGATTITTNTVAGAPTKFYATMGTPHTFTDPVTSEVITIISEATAVDFAGTINAGKVDIVSIAPGYTDLGSQVGDIIILRPVTEWANNLFNVLSVAHNDNGTIKDDAISSASMFADPVDPVLRMGEALPSFVASGLVWSALTGLNATMTLGVVYIAGTRIPVAAVATRAFTASKDTYIDVNSSGTIVYTEVTTAAAAPALAANSLRLAKVVAGASITSILTSGSDSLLNLIRPLAPGTKWTEPNGWTVKEYGNGFRTYEKLYSFSSPGSVGADNHTALGSGINNWPVGIVHNQVDFQATWTMTGNTPWFNIAFESVITDGSVGAAVYCRNVSPGAQTPGNTNVWAMLLTK